MNVSGVIEPQCRCSSGWTGADCSVGTTGGRPVVGWCFSRTHAIGWRPRRSRVFAGRRLFGERQVRGGGTRPAALRVLGRLDRRQLLRRPDRLRRHFALCRRQVTNALLFTSYSHKHEKCQHSINVAHIQLRGRRDQIVHGLRWRLARGRLQHAYESSTPPLTTGCSPTARWTFPHHHCPIGGAAYCLAANDWSVFPECSGHGSCSVAEGSDQPACQCRTGWLPGPANDCVTRTSFPYSPHQPQHDTPRTRPVALTLICCSGV